MREKLWFALRKSALLRRAYGLPAFCWPLRLGSFLLVPSVHSAPQEWRELVEGVERPRLEEMMAPENW